jgi:phage gp37-like protein
MVTLATIEDAIVQRLKDDEAVAFKDTFIIVGSVDDRENNALMTSGGIAVMYAGSTKLRDGVHGRPFLRTAVFVVMIGRKMIGRESRLTHDIESVVEALTKEPINGLQLEWRDDRFALTRNQVAWHDVTFTLQLAVQP